MKQKTAMMMVTTSDPDILVRALEAYGRCAAGLVMEDIPAMVMVNDAEDMSNGMPGMGGDEGGDS